jgi:nuclear pore complex protein Nup155
MLLNLSQVLGWTDPAETATHTQNVNSNSSNAANAKRVDQKLTRSRLQDRRAAELSAKNNVASSSYISSFNFFNLVPNSTAVDPAKKHNDIINLNHLPLSTSSPINLASQCISAQVDKDETFPSLHEKATSSFIDNYNLNYGEKKNPFSRFERSAYYGIPQKLLDLNNESMVTNMGIFPEIGRAWLSADNRLYIWNYNASVTAQEFDVINDFEGTIITCALVKPKPNVFVESVNHLIVVATSKEMKLLALQYKPSTGDLEISDTHMSVSIHGLIVNNIVFFENTKDILFTGAGSGDAIWKLDYSNTKDWFSKSIKKEKLVESTIGSKLLNVPGLDWLNSDQPTSTLESIIDIKIDQSRHMLYTLSSKSVIRAYKINIHKNKLTITSSNRKTTLNIMKDISISHVNSKSPLLKSGWKIVNIFPVSRSESNSLYLIAVTSTGCRIYINGTNLGNTLNLTARFVKFPPLNQKEYKNIEQRVHNLMTEDPTISVGSLTENQSINSTPAKLGAFGNHSNQSFNSERSIPADKSITKSSFSSVVNVEEVKHMQEASMLLAETSCSMISSPGIFIGFSKTLGVYTSVPDYGILKKHAQYVEDFEIHERAENVFGIAQLVPSATNTRHANEFAHQYTEEPMEFAVLTSTGIYVYHYRTPDLILEDSLNDATFKQFALKYGYDEACSTALYLACKYDKSESFRNLATRYFISGGRNSKLDRSMSPIIDNVEPSDRFFAVLLLLSRLISQIWKKNVFSLRLPLKFNPSGYINTDSLKALKDEPNVILEGINIRKQELDYLLCSVLILIKFLEDNKNSIPGFSLDVGNQHETTSWKEKATEVCIQAEQICFTSISKFLNVVKEGLSFLAILLEEYEDVDNKNFKDIISFLPLQLQADLSCIKFSDFFTKGDDDVSTLIKELLSCILSKNISEGNSVELVAQTLQEKCGFFCSTDDVLIFKAIENLKKAKNYSDIKDNELKLKSIEGAIKLLKQTSDSLNDETIADCVNAILQLGYYPEAVEFLLSIANTPEMNKLTSQMQSDLQFSSGLDATKLNAYHRKHKLYHIIFQILVDIDKKALASVEQASDATLIGTSQTLNNEASVVVDNEGNMVTYYSKLRDECYTICLNYKDKMFHYEFYKWFVANGVGEKLLYIETPYILEFLREKATIDLEMSKLLWIYYSKKGSYYEAANQLYELSLSKFDIKLVDRIQFLSIANSFIQVVETQLLKQDIMDLASRIQDLISVSNLQDELLSTISQDSRMGSLAKTTAEQKLNFEILTINELYNDYIDPLGYYELALICFKLSDYKNHEDIMSKWESLFDKWYIEYSEKANSTDNAFANELLGKFVTVGELLKDVNELFPITDLLPILFKNVHMHGSEFSQGSVAAAFLKSGVEYDKLYYSFRKLIESTTYEPFKNYKIIIKNEMCYLIREWYKNDKYLREVVGESSISALSEYDLNKDPIFNYMRASGNPL